MSDRPQFGQGDGPVPQVFLARHAYRRRRVMDAARLLPILGIALFFLPVLWRPEGGPGALSSGFVYLFLTWGLLIAVAALIARRLAAPLKGSGKAADRDDDVV